MQMGEQMQEPLSIFPVPLPFSLRRPETFLQWNTSHPSLVRRGLGTYCSPGLQGSPAPDPLSTWRKPICPLKHNTDAACLEPFLAGALMELMVPPSYVVPPLLGHLCSVVWCSLCLHLRSC